MVYRAGVRTRGKVPQRSQIMFQEDLGVEIPHSEAAHCPQDTYSPSLQHLQAAEATASACSCWGVYLLRLLLTRNAAAGAMTWQQLTCQQADHETCVHQFC